MLEVFWVIGDSAQRAEDSRYLTARDLAVRELSGFSAQSTHVPVYAGKC